MKHLVLSAAILLTSGIGYADTFSINNTGVGAAPGNTDPNWTVTTSPIPGSTNAFVTDTSGYPFPIWLADTAGAGWDSPQSSYTTGQTDTPGTAFYYTTSFDLTGFDPNSAALQFQYAVDDILTAIILNGNMFTSYPTGNNGGLSAPQTLDPGSGFVAGVNTLTFEVFNAPGATGNPSGLFVDFTSATATTSPEPSAFLLIGAGLGGLGLIRRRMQSR